MEESKELQKLYGFMQAFIYITVCIEILLFVHFPFSEQIMPLLSKMAKIPIYSNILYSKLFTFFIIMVTCIGTRSKKDLELDPTKQIIFPLIFGFIMFFGSICFLFFKEKGETSLEWYNIAYIILSIIGATLINSALDNISKRIKSNFMKDRFNIENESFEQSKDKVETEFSVNIPMKFFYNRKWHNGWLNICNCFRGTFVIGTPGSGKSFSVINSFIRQHSAKGFAEVVYDFKFPELAKIAYYNYQKNKQLGKIPSNFKFNVINFSDIEYSRRINPLKREYIEILADATETAEALYESLQKGDKGSGGNSDFFKTSAVNLLAASIYFWSRYENGKYSDLPHVLAFLNQEYDVLFKVLFSEPFFKLNMRLLKLTLLLVLCACTHSVYAQRHYVGISALEVNYGLNIFGRNNTNLNLSVSKYRSRTTYWKIGLNYFEKSYNYSYESNTAEVPTIVSFSSTAKDYYIDAAYFKTVATNLSSLYFSLGLGLFTGVEAYKRQDNKYDFLLGLKIEPELEYFVSPRVAILGRVKQYWSPFSYASKWNTVWNLGVKVLIY